MALHYYEIDRTRCSGCENKRRQLRRIIEPGIYGATTYACLNVGECIYGTDISKLDTWELVVLETDLLLTPEEEELEEESEEIPFIDA